MVQRLPYAIIPPKRNDGYASQPPSGSQIRSLKSNETSQLVGAAILFQRLPKRASAIADAVA